MAISKVVIPGGGLSSPAIQVPASLHTWAPHGIGGQAGDVAQAVTSTAWPSANLAIYVPVRVMEALTVKKLFWVNGATVGGGHADCGLYDASGNRLTSTGSTVTAGATAVQSVDITDYPLPPGLYYLALALDTNTDTIRIATSLDAQMCRMCGQLQQASAFALPSSATFALNTMAGVPGIGAVVVSAGV